jgi:hypothetical protein
MSLGRPLSESRPRGHVWPDEPIPLPRGRELVTLKDAGTYITKLPKSEHEAPEWQAAMQALILIAASGGPTMLAPEPPPLACCAATQ